MSGDVGVQKEIENLELEKKELELFINTYKRQSLSSESPRHSRGLGELKQLFTSAEIIEETFQIGSLPSKIGYNEKWTQEFKIKLSFKSFPFLLIAIDLTTLCTAEDSHFYQVENIVFSATSSDYDVTEYESAFNVLNKQLSQFDSSPALYLQILKRFLTLLSERESAFDKVKQSLAPDQYEISVYCKESNEWEVKYLKNSSLLATMTWAIVLSSEFSVDFTYLLEFSDAGARLARSFHFSEEIIAGYDQSWNATKCVEELINLTSLA